MYFHKKSISISGQNEIMFILNSNLVIKVSTCTLRQKKIQEFLWQLMVESEILASSDLSELKMLSKVKSPDIMYQKF